MNWGMNEQAEAELPEALHAYCHGMSERRGAAEAKHTFRSQNHNPCGPGSLRIPVSLLPSP